ncbi:MAG: DNA polymerase ligase N-terminal domain-containing protein [Thermodesulfobacteriota bacterium]
MSANRREMRFVVQEHHARALHYDFRLEMGGVLKSWAIPKGPSMNPVDKRLAVLVEDHPLDYFDYEGIIPEGEYGAGAVLIWDMGTYRLTEGKDPERAFEQGKILMELDGKILKGSFSLIQMKGRGDDNWLLMKKKDLYGEIPWTIEKAMTDKRRKALREKLPNCKIE